MKYNEKMILLNVIVVLYGLWSVFLNNYISGVCILVITLFLQIIMNHGLVRISEVAARFSLDSFPEKQMVIEAELNSGNITEKESADRLNELKKEIDFFGKIGNHTKAFSRISKIINFCLISIVIILLIIKGLKIYVFDNSYIMIIIKCGIISQILMFVTSSYIVSIIVKSSKIEK